MQNSTLVWKGIPKNSATIQVYSDDDNTTSSKLMNSIFSKGRTDRIKIVNGRYRYTPSEEYNKFISSFRK